MKKNLLWVGAGVFALLVGASSKSLAQESALEPETTTQETEVQSIQQNTAQPAAPGAPANNTNTVQRTTITEKKPNEGGLRNEAVGLKPQFGVLTVQDALGGSDARAVAGMTVDINGLRRVPSEGGRPYLGPSLGILYSHLGTSSSDFFGLNGAGGNQSGTHLLLIPFNLKAGYTVSDIFRPSVHVGGTLVYNNNQAAGTLTGVEASRSSTSFIFNIGLDFEFGIGRNVGILIRPDWIFSDRVLFVGTFGLVFPIS